MYNTQVELNESGGTNYIPLGVHKVFIDSLKIEQLNTPGYNGNIARLVIKDDDGRTLETTIYPFKFNPELKRYEDNKLTDQILTQEEQLKDYLQKKKEIFARASQGGEEAYNRAIATVTTFEEFIGAISPLVCKSTGGNYIWQLIKANKKNYSTIALHKGGSTRAYVEGEPCPITFDEAKYGKKVIAQSAVEAAPNGQKDDLPF